MGKVKQELTISGVSGIIVIGLTIILFILGFTPLISILPFAVYAAAILLYFIYVLFRAPKVLDSKGQLEIEGLNTEIKRLENQIKEQEEAHQLTTQSAIKQIEDKHSSQHIELIDAHTRVSINQENKHQEKVRGLTAEIDLLKSQLEELKKYKVIFEINTRRTQVRVNEGPVGCYILADIKMRFDNLDTNRLNINNLKLTLHERTDAGETPEIESQLLNNHQFFPVENSGPLTRKDFEPFSLEGRNLPCHRWFKAELSIRTLKNTELIYKRHFLRMTMFVMGQPPLPVNMDVDWERAIWKYTRVIISNT